MPEQREVAVGRLLSAMLTLFQHHLLWTTDSFFFLKCSCQNIGSDRPTVSIHASVCLCPLSKVAVLNSCGRSQADSLGSSERLWHQEPSSCYLMSTTFFFPPLVSNRYCLLFLETLSPSVTLVTPWRRKSSRCYILITASQLQSMSMIWNKSIITSNNVTFFKMRTMNLRAATLVFAVKDFCRQTGGLCVCEPGSHNRCRQDELVQGSTATCRPVVLEREDVGTSALHWPWEGRHNPVILV